jgi:hypothetical protein
MSDRPSYLLSHIQDTVCEAIAATTSEDKKWSTVARIRQYFEDYSEIDPKKVERNLMTALKDLEKKEVLVRKRNSFTFMALETAGAARKAKKPKEKTKPQEEPKKLGPDVVLTSSGRISYRIVN